MNPSDLFRKLSRLICLARHHPSNRALQREIYRLQDLAAATAPPSTIAKVATSAEALNMAISALAEQGISCEIKAVDLTHMQGRTRTMGVAITFSERL